MSGIKIHFDEISFQFVFKNIPEVVPDDMLKDVAEKHGFEVVKDERVFKSPLGEIIVLNIGRKGGIDLLYDLRESFIGVGTKTGDLGILRNHVKNELKKMIEELGIQNDVKFYRITTVGRTWYGKNTKEVLKDVIKIESLEEIERAVNLNVKLQPMTLRLIPANRNFGELPWIDISVEPLVANPKYYYYALTYMDDEYERCLSLLDNLKDIFSRIFSYIRGE